MPKEHEIRELAYYLWVSEGKPSGQSEKHWEMATMMAEERAHHGEDESKQSVDPSEAKGAREPAQPDQT